MTQGVLRRHKKVALNEIKTRNNLRRVDTQVMPKKAHNKTSRNDQDNAGLENGIQ